MHLLVEMLIFIKPITDFFWNQKHDFLGYPVNPQTCLSLVVLALSLTVFLRRKRALFPQVTWLFLFVLLLGVADLAFRTQQASFTLKYLSGLAIFPLCLACGYPSQTSQRQNVFLKPLALAVIAALLIAAILQIAHVLPFYVYEDVHHTIPRLSGPYYHPLDFVRVSIWYQLAITLAIFSCTRKRDAVLWWAILFVIDFVLYKTTHRSTFVLTVVATLFLGWRLRQIKTAAMLIAMLLFSFAASSRFFNVGLAPSFDKVFLANNFIDVQGRTQPDPQALRQQKPSTLTISVARARSKYWSEHVKWISGFSLSEHILGTSRQYPEGQEAEPHNQIIDFHERYGLLGLTLIASFLFAAIRALKPDPTILQAGLIVMIVYAMITEILVMPTFVWFLCLWLTVPAKMRHETFDRRAAHGEHGLGG